uniref:Uncharacterized protein n=1 Tax=Panagrolaimus sp. JU765 TaxID=591449 RepID=A0AC34RNZ1_9BILA
MLIFSCSRENFINSHINNMAPESKIEKSKINSFTKDYLKMDGIFVLRMITMHAGIIFGYDLISSLYDDFYCSLEKKRQSLPKFKTVDFKNEKDAEKVKLFS